MSEPSNNLVKKKMSRVKDHYSKSSSTSVIIEIDFSSS